MRRSRRGDCARITRTMLSGALAFVSVLLASPGLPGRSADTAPSGRPPIRLYTTTDGLPVDGTTAVVFDQEGYLWVGTQEGLARYNGHAWTTVRLPTPSNFVWGLKVGKD